MDGRTPARVVFHASLVFLIALACGVPYTTSITNGAGEDVVRGWRVVRGLVPGGSLANTVAFVGNFVASIASIVGMVRLAAGARAAARAR